MEALRKSRHLNSRHVTFPFDDTHLALISQHRGDHNRLGFAVQLGTVRFLGSFLTIPVDMSQGVMAYVSQKLHIAKTGGLSLYMEPKQTYYAHSNEIQNVYNYHSFNKFP